jgi:hypothetical protein
MERKCLDKALRFVCRRPIATGAVCFFWHQSLVEQIQPIEQLFELLLELSLFFSEHKLLF